MKTLLSKYKYYLLEYFLFLTPLLVILPGPEDHKVILSIKFLIFSLSGLIAFQFLVYTLLEKQEKSWLKTVVYLLKVLISFIVIVFASQLLKSQIPGLGFTLYLFLMVMNLLSIKVNQSNESFYVQTLISYLKYFSIIYYSFFIYIEPHPVMSFLFAFCFALLSTGFDLSKMYDQKISDVGFKERLPGVLYYLFIALAGILIIIDILPWIFFMLFFLAPLIAKFTPSKKTKLSHDLRLDYQKKSKQFFLICMGVMILLRAIPLI